MVRESEHTGSSLDELLEADGTLAEVTQVARQRVEEYEREQAEQQRRGAVHIELPFKRVAGG